MAREKRQPKGPKALPLKHTEQCPDEATVWVGTKWVCNNHYPPIPVTRTREKYIPPARLKLAQMLDRDDRDELGKLRDNVESLRKDAIATDAVLDAAKGAAEDVPGILAERDKLRARVKALEAGAVPAALEALQAEAASAAQKLAAVEAERDALLAGQKLEVDEAPKKRGK